LKRRTEEEMKELKKRAFHIYTSTPNISNTKLAKEVGVSASTIQKWFETSEWQEWSEKAYSFINARLRDEVSKLDKKIIQYVDDLITGSLEQDQLKGASAVVNIFKSRLEMAGFINKKTGVEINNNFLANKQINNIAIENMTEEQLLKFVTTNEVPKMVGDEKSETLLLEPEIILDKKEEPLQKKETKKRKPKEKKIEVNFDDILNN
jgi:transposase